MHVCVRAFVLTCACDAIFMTNSAATCLFCERRLNRNKESGEWEISAHLTSAYAIQSAWRSAGPRRLPKHFEVNKLLIFSISTDDSTVSSRETEKQEEERGGPLLDEERIWQMELSV